MRKPRALSCVLIVSMLMAPPLAFGQDQGGGINRNPGDILDNLIGGPQITETSQEPEDRLPGLLAVSIAGIFAALQVVIPAFFNEVDFTVNLPFLSGGGGGDGSGGGSSRVIMTELANDGDNSFVEISNPGGLRLALDDWAFCLDVDARDCQSLTGLILDPVLGRSSLVLQLGGDPDPSILDQFLFLEVVSSQGELALFDFGDVGELDPSVSSAMRAYITWGPQLLNPTQLQNVALDASLWRQLETISPDSGLREISVQLNPNSLQLGGRDADDYTVVPFANNTLGSTDGSTAPLAGENGTTDPPADGGAAPVDDRNRSAFTRSRG